VPFVEEEHRQHPDVTIPGDRCFVEYKRIMAAWRENPRWTTVDKIASWIWPNPWKRALMLAFMVFFAMHVLDYERLKREENGDIE
jgi:hypothetical protein